MNTSTAIVQTARSGAGCRLCAFSQKILQNPLLILPQIQEHASAKEVVAGVHYLGSHMVVCAEHTFVAALGFCVVVGVLK